MYSSLGTSIGRSRGPDVLVLCYHAVSPQWKAPLSVTPEALASQLSTLVRRDWRGATFTEAVSSPPFRRTLVVSFDDAFLSVLKYARPILGELGLPGTVLAPTAFMEQRQRLLWPGVSQWADTPFADELEGMAWADLQALAHAGWEVGSHTRTHPHLTKLDDDQAAEELERSRRECCEHVGSCTSVAYPYGDVDDRIVRIARDAGYIAGACLSSRLSPAGPHLWPRIGIYHQDAAWRFRLKASGTLRHARATRLWPGG